MPSSSHRSSSIPISFDRFRVRSFKLVSPIGSHQYEKPAKQSPERSRIRKTQVQPTQIDSSEQIDRDAAYLFHAHREPTAPAVSKESLNKKCSNKFFDSRPTSNVVGGLDLSKLPVKNAACSSQPQASGYIYPSTRSVIHYRHSSLPVITPTRIIRRPKSFDNTIKQLEFGQIDQVDV